MRELKVGPNNRAAIAAIAASLRRRAVLVEPSYSTMQIIETCFPGTVVSGRALENNCDELVRVDSKAFKSHKAPHRIWYNRKLSGPEQRYAIAHAIGHIVFDGPRSRGVNDNAANRELRCDRFADELLVPLAELPAYVGGVRASDDPEQQIAFLDMCDQIASHFQVPSGVIVRRINELRPLHR
jgi:hypothetical protein